MLDVSSPKQRCGSSHGRLVLHLGDGKARLGEGVCPGEPEDNEDGLSSPPRRGVAHLGEPLRLGKPLHLGEPTTV